MLDKVTASPVMHLELILVTQPTSGEKMALCCLKQDQLSPSLLSDCLMLESIPVRLGHCSAIVEPSLHKVSVH